MNTRNIEFDSLSHIFSHSQISTFKSCPQQYKIVYLDGTRKSKESIEAFMGKRVHETLEWLYEEENRFRPFVTFDRLCQIYDEYWVDKWHREIYIADPFRGSDFYYSIGKRCLANYYNLYGPTFNQSVQATEVNLNFKIGEYNFRGIIDRLDSAEPGVWVVHDYKTSKRAKTDRQAANDMQLALYQIAVEQNYGPVNEISLKWHFLRHGVEVNVKHSKEQIDKLKSKLIKMASKISGAMDDENNFIPKESILCNWCYLWEECTAKVGANPVRRAD